MKGCTLESDHSNVDFAIKPSLLVETDVSIIDVIRKLSCINAAIKIANKAFIDTLNSFNIASVHTILG